MLEKGLEQAEVPPSPLPSKHRQVIRHFRPADGIRYELYFIGFFMLEMMLVKPDDDFHILRSISAPIASNLQDRRLEEQGKGTGKYQKGVQGVPSHSAEQEGPGVLHDLEHRKGLWGKIDRLYGSALDGDAVQYPHNPAAGDDGDVAFHDRRDELDEAVLLQKRISVDGTEEGALRYVDPAVEGIGLAAPFLVDDDEIRNFRAIVKPLHGRR